MMNVTERIPEGIRSGKCLARGMPWGDGCSGEKNEGHKGSWPGQ